MGLTIANRHILPFTDQCVQHITSVGFIPENQTPMTGGLKQEGDFISILGSHRGELGGTKYMQNFYPDIRVNPPTVDLAIEPLIHEVLLKSIQEGFIQSAYNVSAGGLAVAIALSLISGEEGIGARIHLSRKIRNDELLFGETQGLILISFEENNFVFNGIKPCKLKSLHDELNLKKFNNNYCKLKKAKLVKKIFSYNSEKNRNFLSKEKIKKLIEKEFNYTL